MVLIIIIMIAITIIVVIITIIMIIAIVIIMATRPAATASRSPIVTWKLSARLNTTAGSGNVHNYRNS